MLFHGIWVQAEPLFRDKKKFHLMADPSLNGNYPEKGFHQALAVAAMCLQGEATIRPQITDVVTALDYLNADKIHDEEEEDDDDHDSSDDDYEYDSYDDDDDDHNHNHDE